MTLPQAYQELNAAMKRARKEYVKGNRDKAKEHWARVAVLVQAMEGVFK